jgi:serine/threonine protein kinase
MTNDALGPTLLDSQDSRPAATPRASTAPRFEPIRVLGRGGAGEVTLARDNDIDRAVAVKRLRAGVNGAQHVERFLDEIRTVGRLEHPNIAAIHDLGVDADGHYFVMRFVDGETLEAIIAKLAVGDPAYHARFPFFVRCQLFQGMLNAIQYAHAKGVVHRDIKPSNIMVGRCGEVVMMDWGIASMRRTPTADDEPRSEHERMFRTRHGTLLGTPAYMSPEQACGENERVDGRSDIYSLCVVFYELLTLRHYLPGVTALGEMLSGVISTQAAHASTIVHPHQQPVPVELGWFVQVGLAKDPEQRYQSVDEMIVKLSRALSGSFQVRCYMTALKRGGASLLRFVDTNPRLSLAAVLCAATLCLAGLVGLVALVVLVAG